MKLFNHLTEEQRKDIFFIEPDFFNKDSQKDLLSYAVGAVLYTPAIRDTTASDIMNNKHRGLTSLVICLEDAIGDNEVKKAEEVLVSTLNTLHSALLSGEIRFDDMPLIFIRARNPEHVYHIAKIADTAISVITGFVFPKFTHINGEAYFENLSKVNKEYNQHFYGMPILETQEIIYLETRLNTLENINLIINKYSNLVLNIRIGATDFCSLFGMRRSPDTTIYDISVMNNCIGTIINFFSRECNNYVISGPVWEYFSSGERVLKPQLRQTPFKERYGSVGLQFRTKILDRYIDGLIREVLLDKTNGIVGKTIIHPSHILPVQSLYVVSHEEYMDAKTIIEKNDGNTGVFKSLYSNKMNEIKPHLCWAQKIMAKSKIYGVFYENKSFTNLLTTEEDI